MQKLPENEKLEKQLNLIRNKCVDLETNRTILEKEINLNFEKTIQQIDEISHENKIIKEKLKEMEKENEILIRNKENNLEETINHEETVLEDLREKYNLLLNESQNVAIKCEQLNDPNFILMTLSNWDLYYLNKFLVDLNTHIINS